MITLQKWRVISLVVLGISAVLVLDNPPAIAESPFHPQCSLQSVRGTYGVFFVVSDQGLQQTFAGVAVITADGKGNFLGTETFNSGSHPLDGRSRGNDNPQEINFFISLFFNSPD